MLLLVIPWNFKDEILDREKSFLLKESIIPVVQNSCDHGIEHEGNINLKIRDDNEDLTLIITDDGHGIDPSLVYKKAIEEGIANGSQDYTDEQKINFIFESGVTTKKKASQSSGQGVGMDIVKNNIIKLGGSINLTSVLGEGTTIIIKIPK